jgi:hypothetical protein
MPGVICDGMDALAVRATALQAVERARGDGGPTRVEAKTYRFFYHQGIKRLRIPYRTQDEIDLCKARDPIEMVEQHALATGAVTREQLEAVWADTRADDDPLVPELLEQPVRRTDEPAGAPLPDGPVLHLRGHLRADPAERHRLVHHQRPVGLGHRRQDRVGLERLHVAGVDHTPLFLVSAGVVVDVGAMNSHAPIVSRELGIPFASGVAGGDPAHPRRRAGRSGRIHRHGHDRGLSRQPRR